MCIRDRSKAEIMKLLKSLAISKNKTVFLSTHDLEIAFQIADRLILMDNDHGVTACLLYTSNITMQ